MVWPLWGPSWASTPRQWTRCRGRCDSLVLAWGCTGRTFLPPTAGGRRFAFEHQAEVAFTPLLDADVRRGELRARFDVIVLPDQRPDDIMQGQLAGRLPREFTGGVGPEGVRALRAFVEGGGWLVSVGGASRFVVERFGLAVDELALGAERDQPPFLGPGCILAGRLNLSSPLSHGLPRNVAVWYDQGPVFEPRVGRSILRYAGPDPLLSGGLVGRALLASRAGLVEVTVGSGRVVLFGFRPVYRGQARGTLPLLLNALYLAAAGPPQVPRGGTGVPRRF